jgi:hypothetical protein
LIAPTKREWNKRLDEQLARLLFHPESDVWLAMLRIGLALQVILYLCSLKNDWSYLLAGHGENLASRKLAEAIISLQSPLIPTVRWLLEIGSHLGLGEEMTISLTRDCLLIAASFLLFGLFTRAAAVTVWLLHLCTVKSVFLFSYGVDNFTTIGLFYLMLSPLPDRFTLDRGLRHSSRADPEILGFFRRVLQLHLCLIYFFGGLNKSLGTGWWTGDNIWRALIRQPFDIIPAAVLINWKFLFPVISIFICFVETSYPLFIWPQRTRFIWLICVCGMHVAIGLTMGLYLFSLVMIILNAAAFAPISRRSLFAAPVLNRFF